MWLILVGENAQGGSIRRSLSALRRSDNDVINIMRTLVENDPGFTSCDWIRAELWHEDSNQPVRVLRGQDFLADFYAKLARARR